MSSEEVHEIPWAAIYIQHFIEHQGAPKLFDYKLAFPYMTPEEACALVANTIGFVGFEGVSMSDMFISTFASNLMIAGAESGFCPYILPHADVDEELPQLLGHSDGGISITLGNDVWDPNMFFLRFEADLSPENHTHVNLWNEQ